MDYYARLDVSLRSVAICIVDAKGKVVLEQSVTFEVAEITACLNNFAQPLALVGFEAGAMSRHLFSGLQAEGFETVCMEAGQVNAALSAMRNKTDRTDARSIAQVRRAGWFNPVHIKSREAHLTRALLSSRKAVQQKCIGLANEIRGLFRVFGLRLPSRSGLSMEWSALSSRPIPTCRGFCCRYWMRAQRSTRPTRNLIAE